MRKGKAYEHQSQQHLVTPGGAIILQPALTPEKEPEKDREQEIAGALG